MTPLLSYVSLHLILPHRENSDVFLSEATSYVLRGSTPSPVVPMTRWQEAENRLHILIDILAYVPFKHLTIRFLNASHVLNLTHANKSIEQFKQEAHSLISDTFSSIDVRHLTPTYQVLTRAFNEATNFTDPTMHYLFTDGIPSDRSVEDVSELILSRAFPEKNPLTLMSCTDQDEDVQWMKEIDELAPFTAEIDDYEVEKKEVLHGQGPAFPFTRGFWLISSLVAAINPDDLDALDESLPFSKHTLDDLLGRNHSPQEYQYYYEHTPHALLYVDKYPALLNEKKPARELISLAEQQSRKAQVPDASISSSNSTGYYGALYGLIGSIFGYPAGGDLASLLAPHTQAATQKYLREQKS